jgi:hypothetical protein
MRNPTTIVVRKPTRNQSDRLPKTATARHKARTTCLIKTIAYSYPSLSTGIRAFFIFNITVFWRVASCSLVDRCQCFEGGEHSVSSFYPEEGNSPSNALVTNYQTTRRHISKSGKPHGPRCENLKFSCFVWSCASTGLAIRCLLKFY